MESGGINLDNPVFRAFLTYGGIVLLKTVLMSLFTTFKRVSNKVYANEEDAAYFTGNKTKMSINPDVERVRRAHLNDLENVLPFMLLGVLYVAINPSSTVALFHFRLFAASRLLHTFFYLQKVQPFRALSFGAGLAVNLSMAVQVICQGAL